MRRRFSAYKEQLPKLVKLMGNPGVDQNYTIEKGYRYFDLLVVGGGGGGGGLSRKGGKGGQGIICLYYHN
jgi:hypothetical protein